MTLPVPTEEIEHTYICMVDDCYKPCKGKYGKKWCSMHYERQRKWKRLTADKSYRKYKPENLMQRPEKVTIDSHWYKAVHKWLRENYGQAKYCSNTDCKKISGKYEWSNITGKYLRDINDWQQLCVSCHRRYDLGKKPRGSKRS